MTHLFESTYLISLRALCPLDDVKLDFITLFQALIPLALDGTIVNEDIGSALAAEEAVAFCVVEPLYGTPVLCQWSDSLFSCLSKSKTGSKCAATVTTLNKL
jgi:hypothetical protein